MTKGSILWLMTLIVLLAIPLEFSEFSLLSTSLLASNDTEALAELMTFQDEKTVLVFAHQDDDLLWMLPFWPQAQQFLLSAYPALPQFQELIQAFPPELHYSQRWQPIWDIHDAEIFAAIFTDKCLRAKIVYLESLKERLRPYLQTGVKRVVTHNNWGEYGHVQHRLVNQAVRELAVEYAFDVYALGVQVQLQNYNELASYENVAERTGLPQPIWGFFDTALFQRIRQEYLNRRPYGRTPETTHKLQRWSSTLWTWSPKPLAFPSGWRPFIKLVHAGEDLTLGNEAVRKLTEEQPIINACEEP